MIQDTINASYILLCGTTWTTPRSAKCDDCSVAMHKKLKFLSQIRCEVIVSANTIILTSTMEKIKKFLLHNCTSGCVSIASEVW